VGEVIIMKGKGGDRGGGDWWIGGGGVEARGGRGGE